MVWEMIKLETYKYYIVEHIPSLKIHDIIINNLKLSKLIQHLFSNKCRKTGCYTQPNTGGDKNVPVWNTI